MSLQELMPWRWGGLRRWNFGAVGGWVVGGRKKEEGRTGQGGRAG